MVTGPFQNGNQVGIHVSFLGCKLLNPRHPVIFSADDWGVQSPSKRIVFGFHETVLRR